MVLQEKYEIEWEFENILVFSLTIKETNAKDQPKVYYHEANKQYVGTSLNDSFFSNTMIFSIVMY